MIRWLSTLAAVVVAATILYGLQTTTPSYSRNTAPIVSSGEEGERVAASAFTFKLTNVHVTRELSVESFGSTKSFASSGVWIVVEGEAEALTQSLALTTALWEARNGVRYTLTGRLPAATGLMPVETFQPGLPKPVLLAFEAPESALHGGTLVIARNQLMPLDDQIRIRARDRSPVPALTIRKNEDEAGWTLQSQ